MSNKTVPVPTPSEQEERETFQRGACRSYFVKHIPTPDLLGVFVVMGILSLGASHFDITGWMTGLP